MSARIYVISRGAAKRSSVTSLGSPSHGSFTKRDLVAEAAGRACLLLMKSHYRHGCFIMTIITADKQLVHGKGGDQGVKEIEGEKK